MSKFRYGRTYDHYINQANKNVDQQVEPARTNNGKVLVDFDDYESDIIDEFKGISHVQHTS